ncbi:putative rRNA methyltransferase YlbH-like, partial [Trifolium medium]|nr:putative rRNA methyltransferase YlbH-like [Trifolium medium]
MQAAGGSPATLRPGRWLDLYSGTGSVGIEALSRGNSGTFDYISVTPPYEVVDYAVLMRLISESPFLGEDTFI